MKWFMSSMAVLVLIASGAAWAGETGQTSGSQARKPFKSSETQAQNQESLKSGETMDPTTKGQESEKSTAVQFIDDATITARVKAALAKDPGASALAISVETTKGTVQLSGSVDSADEKMKAESIARGVDGVKEVENKLAVK
ncbi:MAG: BON domain-containing protein [Gammaproteobacteria bacterium]